MEEDISVAFSAPKHPGDIDRFSLAAEMFTHTKPSSPDQPRDEMDRTGMNFLNGIEGAKSVSQDRSMDDLSLVTGMKSFVPRIHQLPVFRHRIITVRKFLNLLMETLQKRSFLKK
mmetsp:Transcript_5088/g.5859  ORF Transcript_5088/g.5859 Transcript_5088/m.5859 type:complete len:115 (+) Transcript_5088:1598-1942(+)